MSFHVKLQYNKSALNKVSKSISDILEVSGVLKENTSILNPIITIRADLADLTGVNYMYISAFGHRSYFVTDIRSIAGGLVEISGKVDVLFTYKSDIRECYAIVSNQQNVYNLYLNDGSFRVRADSKVITTPFPSGFNGSSYVLAVAGS